MGFKLNVAALRAPGFWLGFVAESVGRLLAWRPPENSKHTDGRRHLPLTLKTTDKLTGLGQEVSEFKISTLGDNSLCIVVCFAMSNIHPKDILT